MDPVKEAFAKVREDIEFLYSELSNLNETLMFLRQEFSTLSTVFKEFASSENVKNVPTQNPLKETTPTDSSTYKLPLETLKGENMPLSTGNEGVPTDKQTNQQTNQQTQIPLKFLEKTEENSIDDAARILDSLDGIKKEIRLKFKRLTEQEILVFSTLYQIDEERGTTDYKTLSSKLKLSESSIRDYIGRLIKKGIPLEKKRVNNKTIRLSIPQNLKKIASLSTILQLREL